jgi:hypothetical protein
MAKKRSNDQINDQDDAIPVSNEPHEQPVPSTTSIPSKKVMFREIAERRAGHFARADR